MNTTIRTTSLTSEPTITAGRQQVFITICGVYMLGLLVYLVLRFAVGDQWGWLAFLHNFTLYYFAPLLILLPLAALIHRRSALRLLPFALLALVWYGPYWLPKTVAVPADSPTLTLATFNILPRERDLTPEIDWIRQSSADIVLLQEAPPLIAGVVRDALIDVYPYSDDLPGTTQLSLSRFPILSAEEVDLGQWWVRRLVLSIHEQDTVVYNIHLAMPTNAPPATLEDYTETGLLPLLLAYDEGRRNGLIRTLIGMVQAETLPYIVAGDFNTSDNAPIYAEMAAAMTDSYREVGIGLGATFPAATGEEGIPDFLPPLIRIDYVWHSPAFRAIAAYTGPQLASDHLPTVVTLARVE